MQNIFFSCNFQFNLCEENQLKCGIKSKVEDICVFFQLSSSSLFNILSTYELLHISEPYLLQSVKYSKLKIGQSAKFHGCFLFDFDESKIFQLAENRILTPISNFLHKLQPPFVKSQYLENNEGAGSKPYESVYECITNSYKGKITRIIDYISGIFEIDNEFLLYLTWYPENCQTWLNVGCTILMHNIHFVTETLASKTYIVACSSSFIKILSFSNFFEEGAVLDLPSCSSQSRLRGKRKSNTRKLNFIDLLEINKLKEKIGVISARLIGSYLYNNLEQISMFILEHYFDWKPFYYTAASGILDHDSECKLTDVRFNNFVIESLKTIKDKAELLCKSSFKDSDSNLIHFDEWKTTILNSNSWSPLQSVIFGWVSLDEIGQLQLFDETGNIPISVLFDSKENSQPIYFNRLCMIGEYEVVVEELYNHSKPSSIIFAYIRINSLKSIIYFGNEIRSQDILDVSTKLEYFFFPYCVRPRTLRSINIKNEAISCESFIEGYFISSTASFEKQVYQVQDKCLYIRISKGSFHFLYSVTAGKAYRLLLSAGSLVQEGKDTFFIDAESVYSFHQIESDANCSDILTRFIDRHRDFCGYFSISDAIAYGQETLVKGKMDLISVQGKISSKRIIPTLNSINSFNRQIYCNIQKSYGVISLPNHDFRLVLTDNSHELVITIQSPSVISKFSLM